MIKITVTQENIPLVYNATDWQKLREEYRIVGSFVGCLAQKPYQENVRGLPLALLPEETTLLLENNVVQLIDDSYLTKTPNKFVKTEYKKYSDTICEEQIECLIRERKRQIEGNLDRIVEGKQKKLMGLKSKKKKKKKGKSKTAASDVEQDSNLQIQIIDRNQVLQEELNKVKTPPKSAICVQLFTAHPWFKQRKICEKTWKFPSSPFEILRYNVFKDFWGKGYYLTSGMKYGAHFLVYPGDPFLFHAYYLVICIDKNATFRPTDLAALSRLGTSARKSVVLAYGGSNYEINYETLQWSSIKDL